MTKSRRNHILFAGEGCDTFLIDIPESIATGQDFGDEENDVVLLSSRAVEVPYTSTEPKTDSARSKIENDLFDDDLHAIYQTQCAKALRSLEADFASGPFCLPRTVKQNDTVTGQKRNHAASHVHIDPTACLQMILGKVREKESRPWAQFEQTDPLSGSQTQSPCQLQLYSPYDVEMYAVKGKKGNASLTTQVKSERAVTLHVEHRHTADDRQESHLRLPPGSCSIVGPCEDVTGFRRLTLQYSTRGCFDLILIDPPWPNRSAARKNLQRGGYKTYSLRLVQTLLSRMDLDIHVKPSGYIAIWITNKRTCRQLAMDLFEQWNVALTEEWVFLKLAANGEPVTELDGIWRKPYEVLLIAQSPRDRLRAYRSM